MSTLVGRFGSIPYDDCCLLPAGEVLLGPHSSPGALGLESGRAPVHWEAREAALAAHGQGGGAGDGGVGEGGEGGAGVEHVQQERVGACQEEQQGNGEDKGGKNFSFGYSLLGLSTIYKKRR